MDTARGSGNAYIRSSIEAMQNASTDDRGTLRALAKEIEDQSQDGKIFFSFSSTYI
jgi:hypothetical protein